MFLCVKTVGAGIVGHVRFYTLQHGLPAIAGLVVYDVAILCVMVVF